MNDSEAAKSYLDRATATALDGTQQTWSVAACLTEAEAIVTDGD